MSPQGFPSEKNLPRIVDGRFIPLFTGEVFFAADGLCFRDSRRATGKLRAGMSAGPWSGGRIAGILNPIPPFAGPHDRIKTAARAHRARRA